MAFLPNFDYQPSPLSEEIKQGILQVNQAHYLFLFTPEESQYIKNRKKALLSYQAFLESNQPIPNELRTSIRDNPLAHRVHQKEYIYGWKKQQQQCLANNDIWAKLIESCPHASEIKTLQLNWQAHGSLSRWNHQSLLFIATTVLPKLIHYHQRELQRSLRHQGVLPPDTQQAYQQYLQDFLAQAQKLKSLMAESMLARLRSFSFHQFQHADVTLDTLSQLQSLGSLSKMTQLPSTTAFEPLTPQQFSAFHGYLSKHFPKDEAKLANLSWFNHSGEMCLVTKEHSFKTYLAPKVLAGFIPLTPRRPAFLFRGYHFRRKFFKNKNILLAAVTSPTVYPHALSQSAITHTLQQLQQKESNLHELQVDLSQQKRRFSSFRHGQTQRFLQQWGGWLQSQQTQVRNTKMDFFQRLLNDFETQDGRQLIFPWETCQVLEKTLRQLEQESYPGKGGGEPALTSIAKRFETWLSLNKAYQLIKDMAEGKLIQPSELAFINDYYQTLQLYRPQEAQAFTEMAQPFIDACGKKLKMALSTFSLTEKNNSNLQPGADEVLALDYVVGIFATSAQKATISSQLSKCSLRYLTTLLSSNETMSCQVVETILEHAGNKIVYGAQTLATSITELKQLREQGEWGVLRAKCRSLVVIINQNLLQKRLTKEIAYLDEGMKGILENHPDLRDSPASVNRLLQLRDQMVEKGISDVQQIRLTLPVHQQVLINKVCQHNKAIAPLFKLSSKVHAIYRQQQTNSSLLEKNAQIEKLQHTASKVFSRAPQLRTLLQSHAAFFKKRDFFSKRYVDETVSKQLTR